MENNTVNVSVPIGSDTDNLLNEISYKMDSVIHFQEQQWSSSLILGAILIVFIICFIVYKFITDFIDF